MSYLEDIGRYFLMLKYCFTKMTKGKVLRKLIFKEINEIIIGALGISLFLAFFIGAVIAIQTALNLSNPFIPKQLIGFASRQSVILEFAPTFISVVMAGKIGSFITSSIGTMRVTEQIDALEVMGINALNYLVFPKIVTILFYPFVIGIAMFMGIFGAYFAGVYGGFLSHTEFTTGLREEFIPFHLVYAFVKAIVFGFILITVPAYHGFYMQGGALEVGKANTTAFVWTTVLIVISNYILTQILLS